VSRPWTLLIFLTSVNLLNYIDRQIVYAVFPPLQTELGLSDTQLGLLASSFMWVYLSTAPIFGLLADRWSRPRLMAAGIGIWSVATAFSGVVHNYAQLVFGRAAVGIGEASYGSIAPAMLSDVFAPAQRGQALAFFSMAIPAGSALGYLLGGGLERWLGWRASFLIVALPGLSLTWFMSQIPEPSRANPLVVVGSSAGTTAPRMRDYANLLRTPSYVLTCLAMTAMTFAVGGLAAWVPTYLTRVRGMELAQANLTFGLLTLISGVGGTMAGGWIGDRLVTRIRSAYFLVSGAGLTLSVPCAAAVILAEDRSWVLAAIFLAELFIFLNTGPLNAIIANVSRAEVRATAYAANIFVIHALGDALSPTVVGMISDHVGLAEAFWIAPAALTLAACFCFWGMRYLAKDESQINR
jgi:predicted MFS family arabinose efflux permease